MFASLFKRTEIDERLKKQCGRKLCFLRIDNAEKVEEGCFSYSVVPDLKACI